MDRLLIRGDEAGGEAVVVVAVVVAVGTFAEVATGAVVGAGNGGEVGRGIDKLLN